MNTAKAKMVLGRARVKPFMEIQRAREPVKVLLEVVANVTAKEAKAEKGKGKSKGGSKGSGGGGGKGHGKGDKGKKGKEDVTWVQVKQTNWRKDGRPRIHWVWRAWPRV